MKVIFEKGGKKMILTGSREIGACKMITGKKIQELLKHKWAQVTQLFSIQTMEAEEGSELEEEFHLTTITLNQNQLEVYHLNCLNMPFSSLSGLRANPLKSDCFVSCRNEPLREDILNSSRFRKGDLPMRYPGVPLLSTKLSYGVCHPIIDKVRNKICGWRNRLLSFGGCLQLAQFVLSTIYVYWAFVFILPKRVIHEIEQIIRNFLWSGNEANPHRAKVAWHEICCPKDQGGLGLKLLYVWNQDLVSKLIWHLLVGDRVSLCVKWVHTYRVKGACFWLLKVPYACPWYWQKLLLLREVLRSRFGWRIGDDRSTFFWHDHWHPLGVLIDRFSRQLPQQLGISIMVKVSKFIEDGSWICPENSSSPPSNLVRNLLPSLLHLELCDEPYSLPTSNRVFSIRAAFQDF